MPGTQRRINLVSIDSCPGTSRVTGALTIGPAVCIGADTRGGSGIGSGAGSGANLAVRAAEAASKSSSKWGCALIQRAQLRTNGRRLCAKSLSDSASQARIWRIGLIQAAYSQIKSSGSSTHARPTFKFRCPSKCRCGPGIAFYPPRRSRPVCGCPGRPTRA